MKITVEFDLSTEEGKADFEDFKNMRRNARFWDEIYDEVFRDRIKHGDDWLLFEESWNKVNQFRKELEG